MAEEHNILHEDQGRSMEFIMNIVLLVVTLFLVVYYLLPVVRSTSTQFSNWGSGTINFNRPGG